MIRPFEPSDTDRVVEVWLAASRVAHPFLTEEILAAEAERIRTVHMVHADTWVWESDGRVDGFVALLDSEIGGLFVSPDRQRAGIGRALVDFVRPHHPCLDVEVFEDNVIGRSFYARYGFRFVSRHLDEATGQTVHRLRYEVPTSD